MKKSKERNIVGGRIWMIDETNKLVGFAHEQDGYSGILFCIKEMKRMAKIIKRDLHKT
jgi:hypothetical protein